MMIPMALLLGAGFVFAFIWATKNGQFDDVETPAHRALLDDSENNNEFIKRKRHE